MDIQAEKLYLIEQLIKVRDVKVIRQLQNILDQQTDTIIGYRVNGDPITRKQLEEKVQEAETRIQAGHFTTQEDLEREAENW